MTLYFIDSCNGNEANTKWNSGSGPTLLPGGSHNGRACYAFSNSDANIAALTFADTTSVLVGFKGLIDTLSNVLDGDANNRTFQIRSDLSATVHLTLGFTAARAITVRRGTGSGVLLATSAPGVFDLLTWHHYEIRAEIHDTTGRFQVWIDGDPTPVLDFTGDTKNAGTKTQIDTVWFGRSLGSQQWRVSDVSIQSGTMPIGVTQVADSRPSGNGATSGLVGSDGNSTDNYLLADETTPNGDTDYNIGDTAGEKDTYAMADLPAGTWDVLGVQVNNHARKSDAGTRYIRPVVRTGGVDHVGTSVVMSETYDTYWQVWETNPGGGAWTQAQVDAIEVGAEARDS